MEQELGRGGMGTVYRVYDTQLERQVALKTIQPKYAKNALAADQFNREIRIMQRVGEHPNIVRVLDKGTLPNNNPYFTMSYIDGMDLKKIIFDTRQTLTLDEIHNFLEQIGSALAYAHGRDVKHRDIKPNNIIKSRDGRFFLTDFGIAVSEGVDTSTRPQIPAWTDGYAAPEILNGAASTFRSDVYSLGMTVTEVCLNCRYKEAVEQSRGVPFSLLEQHKTFVHFVPILKRAIESDPQLRYANIAEFARDFAEQKRRLTPTMQSRPSTVPTAHHRRAQQANRVGVFFVLIILAVVVVAMFIFLNMQSGTV